MATGAMEISLALALASMLFARHGSAQSSSCTAVTMSLAPCLGYITGNASAPSSACCVQLDGAVKSQAQCLCALLNGTAPSFGISVNRTKALALPRACKVQTPPVSRCNAAAPPETPAPPSTPSAPKVPSGKGSNTAPTRESSGGSTHKSTRSPMISVLFLVLCISCITF